MIGYFRNKAWIAWLVKSGFTITEQLFISGSNFLLSVLLARWLTPHQYGTYVIVFAIYALLISVYQSVVLEPMSVLAASLDQLSLRIYLGAMLRVQLKIGSLTWLLLSIVALGVLVGAHNESLAAGLAGLGFAIPFIFSLWLLRCACYIDRSPRRATQSALFYTLTLFAVLYFLELRFTLSGGTVFLCMGLAACASSMLLIYKFRPVWNEDSGAKGVGWTDHWNFGRWELSKVGFDWISENISYTLTAGFLGMGDVAGLKALSNLFLPLVHTMTALRRLVLPHLSSSVQQDKGSKSASQIRNVAILYLIGSAIYALTVSLASRPIMHLLYGAKFSSFTYLVPLLAIAALFGLPAQAIDMGLRAIRSPQSVFTSSCLAALASIAITVPMTWWLGVRGAILSIVVSNLILLLILIVVYRRKTFQVRGYGEISLDAAS